MLQFASLALRRAGTLLFDDVSFTLHAGQKLGLTGANGCGKSSLFALIQGELAADAGEFVLPRDWVIAAVAQETSLGADPALEYVIDGDRELRAVQARLRDAEQAQDATEIAACHERLQEIDGYQAEARAARLLDGLGFEPGEIRRPLREFSGGWIMRLKLARALMCRSDLLLLDEPTNHLDLDAVIWLEGWLQRYSGTLMLISHDRDFLDAVVERIAHVEQGGIQLYSGNYSAFERQRAERLAQQQAAYDKQQQSIAHMQRYIDRFRAKATKARQAQSRIKALERLQRIAPAHVDSPFSFEFRDSADLPAWLVKLDGVATGYGPGDVLAGVDLTLMPGERIGLLGLNGAGKSTCIKLLADELEPSAGRLERARALRIGYFAQHQVEQLDGDASPLLSLQRLAPELSERELRAYLGGFNFRGDKVLEATRVFSGGEKARLVLALLIWLRPNLLLLDEPTNHLDLEMRLALDRALQGYEGCVILVSHDRHLLNSVCDDFYLVDGGRVNPFREGLTGYPGWLARRKRDGATAPAAPTAPVDATALRRELKARRAELNRVERELTRLGDRRDALDSELGDAALYSDAQRDRLRELTAQRAETERDLQDCEARWLELGEAIEGLERGVVTPAR